MGKSIMGIEFGASSVKFAVCEDGKINRLVCVPTPDNLVRDGAIQSLEAMGTFLRETMAREHLGCRRCVAVLTPAMAFTRCTTLPKMTIDQLKLNLPYEFRDYITQGKEKYHYDYALLEMHEDEQGRETMDLMACAALKEDIQLYMGMFRLAGRKLVQLIPEEFAYRNLLLRAFPNTDKIACLVDLGHTTSRLHIFRGGRFEVTRVIDDGGARLEAVIADDLSIDEHLARTRKLANQADVLQTQACVAIYHAIALDIMRAVNFYNYDSRSTLTEIYAYGGGCRNPFLLDEIRSVTGLEIRPIQEILPDGCENEPELISCVAAIGATQQ